MLDTLSQWSAENQPCIAFRWCKQLHHEFHQSRLVGKRAASCFVEGRQPQPMLAGECSEIMVCDVCTKETLI